MFKSNKPFRFSLGFTLMEMLVVFSIIAILASLVISSFSRVGGSGALDTSVAATISLLNEARSLAVSSKDASNYGVRILSDKLISFKNNYGTLNNEVNLNLVSISTSTGIGTDVIFMNVSGSTNASGTIKIKVLNDPTKYTDITIYKTGLIEKK